MRPVAVVTGGSGGLGAAICRALANAGFDVCLTYNRSADAAAAVVRALETTGAAAEAVALDLGDMDAVAAFGAERGGRGGRAGGRSGGRLGGPTSVLVNCAGEVLRIRGDDLTPAQMSGSMTLNCLAPFALTMALVPGMRTLGGGLVLNVGSVLASVGAHDRVAYTTSKAALVGLTRSLAVELAPTVRVNALLPGLFATDMNAGLLADEAALGEVADRIPLRRLGRPEEFAAVVAFLAGPGGAYVTGVAWEVDGGLLARIALPAGDCR